MSARYFPITDGTTTKQALQALENVLPGLLARSHKGFEISLRPRHERRSPDQNRRYWLLLGSVAEVICQDGQYFNCHQWHEWFKRYFLGVNVVELPDGSTAVIARSTAHLRRAAFERYMAQIQNWAVLQGWVLPELPVNEAA